MHATVVYDTFTGETPTTTVDQQILGSPYNSSNHGLSVGLMNFRYLSGDLLPAAGLHFYGFSIEPQESVTAGADYTWSIVSLDQGTDNIGGMGLTKANYLSELFARYYPVFGAALDQSTAGALQIATREIIRETANTFDVSSGNVIFTNEGTSGMLAQAQTMLNSLTGTGPRLNNVVAITAGNNVQDMIIQVPAGQVGNAGTAQPSTFGIAGFALIGLGWLRRRR